jgi:hypothetical protein
VASSQVTSATASRPDQRLLAPFDLLIAAGAGLVAGVVYWLGAAPGLLFGDGGELQFAAWTAGLPHPTGYPLYMIMGWLWTHLLSLLDLASPARGMNLLSVLLAALAVGLTYLFAHVLIELSLPEAPPPLRRLAGLLAAFTFAFTPTFWSQALITEVYALHAALLALILGLALRWQKGLQLERAAARAAQQSAGPIPQEQPPAPLTFRSRPAPALIIMALVLGLSLAHHRTSLLLVPVLFVFIWRQDGYRLRHPRWLLILTLLVVLVPLILYLYVPLRAPHTGYLTMELAPGQTLELVDRSAAGLLDYVLGERFAGELRGLDQAVRGIPEAAGRFTAELGIIGVGLALIGVLQLIFCQQWRLLWLTGASFLLLVAFNLFYGIGDIDVYYIGPYLIACAWLGLGAAWIAQELFRLAQRWGGSRQRATWLASLALLLPLVALPAGLFLQHASQVDRSGHTRPERWWSQLLAADPEPDAVLVSNDRDEMMPLWYLQQVEGIRTDLVGLFPGLLPGAEWANVGQVLENALNTGRPIYLVKPMPGLDVKLRLGANGRSGLTPVEGLAADRPPQRAVDVDMDDTIRLVGYDVTPVKIRPGETLLVDLYWQPLREIPGDLTSFVHLRLPGTEQQIAQSDHLMGGVYYPTSKWEAGETLVDRHRVVLPPDAPPGPYELVTGLYERVEGGIRDVGSLALAGSVGGEPPAAAQELTAANAMYANFGDKLLLIGYELAGPRLVQLGGAPGDSQPDQIQVRLLWQAARPMDRDYTVFLHLVDEAGNLVSQVDTLPLGGQYPTSVWSQGELLTGRYSLNLPRDLPAGVYRLVAGLYDGQHLQQARLAAYDDRGQRFPNDQVEIAEIELRPPP